MTIFNQLLKVLLCITICFHLGCGEDEDFRPIEFWTNEDLSATPFSQLFIDGTRVGTFSLSVNSATCGDPANIDFSLETNSEIMISIQDDDGNEISFGAIELGAFSSGLSINSTGATAGATVSIEGTSNDECTTVRLNW